MTIRTFRPMTLADLEGAVSDTTFGKLHEALDKLSPQGGNEPFIVGDVCPHVVGWDCDFMNTVPIGELLEPQGTTVAQFDVNPKTVISVLMGVANKTSPLLSSRLLIKPITVGVKQDPNDGSLEVVDIVGGRHRLTALLTAYYYSGVDINSADFRRMRLPVFLVPYMPEQVVADNVSRSMPAIELDNISVTEKGVDISDRQSIKEAYKSGVITQANRYIRLMALNFHNFAEIHTDNEELLAVKRAADSLTTQTLASALQSALGEFKNHSGFEHGSKVKADFNRRLNNVDILDHLFVHFLKALPEAIDRCKKMGITNFARNASALGTAIEYVLRTVHKYELPKPTAKVEADASDKEAAKKPARKRRPKVQTEDAAPEVANVPV